LIATTQLEFNTVGTEKRGLIYSWPCHDAAR
jgi:hypothetical protein